MVEALSVEGLTQLGEDGRATPRLAEKWQWTDESKSLHLTLRNGVTFHDGTALTADLVARILTQAINRPANRSLYPSFLDVVAIRAEGDREVIFDVQQPSAFLPEDLELPLSLGNGVGTGPYRVVKTGNSEILLERFDKYHRGAPQIRTVTIRPFQTLRTAWTSLLRGEIDMVSDVPPEAIEFISGNDIRVLSFTRRYQYIVAFNSRSPKFRSSAVRRALNVAIDRQRLIKTILNGHGMPATGPLWPKHWAFDDGVAPYRFDPALARSLLRQSSVAVAADVSTRPPARLRFVCLIPANFTVLERIALEVQRQLYAIGVDMQFEVVAVENYNARVRAGRFEATLIDLISGPTPERPYLFWRSARRFKGLNVFGYENDEADRIFDALRMSSNEAAVRSATSRLQQVMLDDPPAIFLAWNERTRAVRRNFRIIQEPGRDPVDPVYTIWRWTSGQLGQASAAD
jgi:peptide/nickel transport system substrate-binding protein